MARKSKDSQVAKNPQQVKRTLTIPSTYDELPADWYNGVAASTDDSGVEAKSAVFRRYTEPLLDDTESDEERESLYGLAMIGWNLALLPAHARMRLVANLLKEFTEDSRLSIKDSLMHLVARKEELFSDYSWEIYSYHLESYAGGDRLTIAAIDRKALLKATE